MFNGIHHMALITRDMVATTRFWRDALGLPLTVRLDSGDVKHWFFQLTEHDAVAFFEFQGGGEPAEASPVRPGVAPQDGRRFDHVALGVETLDDLYALRERLVRHGVEVRGPVHHGVTISIYLDDPNGINVEVAWRAIDQLVPVLRTDGSADPEVAQPAPGIVGPAPDVRPGRGFQALQSSVARGDARLREY